MASLARPYSWGRFESDRDLASILGHIPVTPLRIVVVGAHPDDPETGCGGSIAKFTRDGHNVTIVYLTRGEAGMTHGHPGSTAAIRTAEAVKGAELLGAQAVFAGQIDGQTAADGENASRFTALLRSFEPDIVFTHWADDTHRDHRNTAELTKAAWHAMDHSFALVHYEVMTDIQTQGFHPDLYIDVSTTIEEKRAAIYAHACQNPDRFYPYHVEMECRRGVEARIHRAEAFVLEPRPSLRLNSRNASAAGE